MSTDLARAIRDRVDAVPVPPGDLDRVRADGTRLRRRRTATAVVAGAAVVAAAAVVALQVGGSTPRTDDRIDPADTSPGLRFYGDVADEFSLAGTDRTNPLFVDTGDQGEPTPYGLVFYSRGVPRLMAPSGEVSTLVPEAAEYVNEDFWPSARADGRRPLVAVNAQVDGERLVIVRDLAAGTEVGSLAVPDDSQIVALDDGVVFLSTEDGTTTWDVETGLEMDLADGRTEVIDVRNGVIAYRGPAPIGPAARDYRLVQTEDQRELTLDGAYLTDRGRVLQSTDGGVPLVLPLPEDLDTSTVTQRIDTDGSVLANVLLYQDGVAAQLYDCGYPSGPCELLETWADDAEESQ